MYCRPPGSSVHGVSPGTNTGVGCHALLQGIFPIQGLNPGVWHCRRILYHLSHQGSPRILEWVPYPFPRGSSHTRHRTGVSCCQLSWGRERQAKQSSREPGHIMGASYIKWVETAPLASWQRLVTLLPWSPLLEVPECSLHELGTVRPQNCFVQKATHLRLPTSGSAFSRKSLLNWACAPGFWNQTRLFPQKRTGFISPAVLPSVSPLPAPTEAARPAPLQWTAIAPSVFSQIFRNLRTMLSLGVLPSMKKRS